MDTDTPTYVALVSGLNLGPENHESMSLQLLVDYITGSIGGPNVCAHSAACFKGELAMNNAK